MTLKGIHIVDKKLANGEVKTYFCAWRGGPRMEASPDDEEAFLVEWPRHTRSKPAPSTVSTFSDLIRKYTQASEFTGLKPRTRESYVAALDRIEAEFHELELVAFEQRGARSLIKEWRDRELADRPRTADLTMAVFNILLNFALDQEFITRNPLEKLGRLTSTTRRDMIWSDAQLALARDHLPRHLYWVVLLAQWTGQRQTDILRLTWSAYDGTYVMLQQGKAGRGKAGRRVKILVSAELRTGLEALKAEQLARANHSDMRKRAPMPVTVLTTEDGKPWKSGFKASWGKAKAALAEIEMETDGPPADRETRIADLQFHDLRGTFITLAHRAGAIAEASGHDEKECERVIRQHYLASGAEIVIERLSQRFTNPSNSL